MIASGDPSSIFMNRGQGASTLPSLTTSLRRGVSLWFERPLLADVRHPNS
jgi:hypothetical protein